MEEALSALGYSGTTGKPAASALVCNQSSVTTPAIAWASIMLALAALNGPDPTSPTTPCAAWVDIGSDIEARVNRNTLTVAINAAGLTAIEDVYAIVPYSGGVLLQKVVTITWTGGSGLAPTALGGDGVNVVLPSAAQISSTGWMASRLGLDVSVSPSSGCAEVTLPDAPGIRGYLRVLRRGTCASVVPLHQPWQ